MLFVKGCEMVSCRKGILFTAILLMTSVGQAQELDVFGGIGNNFDEEIPNGDTTPRYQDGTEFHAGVGGSDHRTFRLKNNGWGYLMVIGVFLSGDTDVFSITGAPNGTEIGPWGHADFTVYFVPKIAGVKTATINILSNDPDELPYTFVLRGTGAGKPKMTVEGRISPPLVWGDISYGSTTPNLGNGTDFVSHSVGSSRVQHFRIRNTGSDTLTYSGSVSGSEFSISGLGHTLLPGATNEFTIAFAPTSIGIRSATVTLPSNVEGWSTFTFMVTGIGLAPDLNLFGGASLNTPIVHGDNTPQATDGTEFGEVNVSGQEVSHTFRLTNNGNQALMLIGANFLVDTEDFSISQFPLPAEQIAPGAHGDFTVTFHPSSDGTKIGIIRLFSNDPDVSPYVFTVQGTGLGTPEISVQGRQQLTSPWWGILDGNHVPSTVNGTDFESVLLGSSRIHFFRIRNDGDGALTYTASLPSTEFSISGLQNTVLPGDTDEFTVTFTPTSFGDKSAMLTLNTNDADENPFSFLLAGFGTWRGGVIEVRGGAPELRIIHGSDAPHPIDGTLYGEQVDVYEQWIDHRFRIVNKGLDTLTVTAIEIRGDTEDFRVLDFSPVNIQVLLSDYFRVRFDPASAGWKYATVAIHNSDPSKDPFTFAIAGRSIESDILIQGDNNYNIPSGSTEPHVSDGTDMGCAELWGDAVQTTFRIYNTGESTLWIDSVSDTHPDMYVRDVAGSIKPQAHDDFSVTFNPDSLGRQTASISITSSDPDESPYTFVVSLLVVQPLRITAIEVNGQDIGLTFVGDEHLYYAIQRNRSTPNADNWDNVVVNIPGTGAPQFRILNGVAALSSNQFFRVIGL